MLRRRVAGTLVVGFLLLAATGCQVTLTAGVDVRADGSGSVRAAIGLDDEALRELGDPARELRLDDLRQSGWTVTGPEKEPDGFTWVRLAKRFADPEEAGRVAAELSGPDGPFREFTVTRSRTFAKTKTRFTGLVDLSNGLAGLSDAALQQALGDFDLGLGADALRARLGEGLGRALQVRVEARLPGRSQTWDAKVGEQLRLRLESESWNVRPVLAAVAALGFAAAALAVVVIGRRR
ncbi:MAG: hypothetical protein ACRD2W_21890 [Acidimicrobiales bacterium]